MEMGSAQKDKTIHFNPSEIDPLNANPDPNHFSYKILGLASWGVLAFCLTSLVVAQRLLLNVARLVAIYMMVRFIAYMVFYLAELVKIRQTEKWVRAGSYQEQAKHEGEGIKRVHHLVVVPNYNEPLSVLIRTLLALSIQARARETLTVVLGMEEREPGAGDKAEALLAMYKDSFYGMLATFHPGNLPGEVPGKGTNETWAVRNASQELVERKGIPPNEIVVTVIDSDSVLPPHYFAELTRQFMTDPLRHSVIWQAPILPDNDIWHTNPAIRLVTYFSNAVSTGDYINPFEAMFPYSSYSLSLKLLQEVNFWDPTLLAEDVNIYMRAFFSKGGRVFIRPIHLPVRSNPIYGVNLWHASVIFFNQKVRTGWGGAEIGYLIQKWNYPPGAPFVYKLGRLLKLIHDHLFFSIAGVIVALGTMLSIMLDHTAVITLPPASFYPPIFIILNLLGGSALMVIWLVERVRLSRGWQDWSLKSLLGEVVSWLIFPVLFFLLMNVPEFLAQTRMLLGQSLAFKRTPKALNSRMNE
jgi:cellulose synthase/poly-beta-1,6-N-acetylglucosamine synthase-like glycosyltransferase